VVVDPDVIDALQDVVEREPQRLALGVHLAHLLLDAGRPREALDRIVAVLAVAPADPAALALRDEAARLVTTGPDTPPPDLRVVDGGRD
jgi:thioredoxin-like negative regulator of GroEL